MGQYEMAEAIISEVKKDISDISELTADLLLDMMGVCGFELAVGEKASLAFINARG
jgi:hypothetical protein